MTSKIQKLIERAKLEWEATVDSLPQLICLLDKQGFIIRANMTLERWGLASVLQVNGYQLHEILHPDCSLTTCYLATFLRQAWPEIDQGNPVTLEVNDETLNRHLHLQIQPVFTNTVKMDQEDGGYAVMVIDDITERKRVEALLRLTQFTVDRAAEAIFWVGSEGQLLYVNESACRILGYSREALLLLTIEDIDAHYPAEVWSIHWRSTKARGPITVETHYRTQERQSIPVEVTFNYLEFDDKAYICAFARDITWRIWSAESLQQSYAQLQADHEDLKKKLEEYTGLENTGKKECSQT